MIKLPFKSNIKKDKKIGIKERAYFYNRKFPKFAKQAPLVSTERWLYGIWMIGNNYQSKQGYYGEYPPTYLNRIMSLFPDCIKILHLFSGTLEGDNKNIFAFDIKDFGNRNIKNGDANSLSNYFEKDYFDLIIADPPYSNEDAEHYGTSMINRNKVVSECAKILKIGKFLVWLDQVFPMFKKEQLELVGTIGLIRSTNHRVRTVFIWQKMNF